MKQNNHFFGTLMILTAGVLNGTLCIFVNNLNQKGLSPSQITSVRMVLAAIIFSIYIFLFHKSAFRIRLKDLWLFAGSGILGFTLFSTLYMNAVILCGAAVAGVLIYTAPAFVMIASVFLFKEKLTPVKIMSLIMTISGCIFVSGLMDTKQSVSILGLILGVGSGISYALYSIFGKIITQKYSSNTMSCYTFLFAALGSLPAGHLSSVMKLAAADPSIVGWSIALALFCGLLSFFTYNIGIKTMEISKASILAMIEPVVGSVLGITLYGESHGPLKIAGITLIIAATIILNITPEKQKL